MRLSVVDQSPVPSGATPGMALANSVDLAALCDRLGYHRYWIAEHHAMQSLASTAPEILIARIGAATEGIRIGSGGVLLPYYAPLKVAETFRMLHALYPDRVDLGLGRAPGGAGWEVHALQRHPDPRLGEDFVQQVLLLRAFLDRDFPEGHQYAGITVSPDMPGGPEMWMLGSSLVSADLAGKLGLPYAFAHFINPAPTRGAIEHYRAASAGSAEAAAGTALAAVGALCAETEDEAERLMATVQLLRRRIRSGDRRPIPTPEEAIAELGPRPPPTPREGEWPRYFYGTPDRVRAELDAFAAALGLEELMIVTITHDHQARRRSYELMADVYGLTGR